MSNVMANKSFSIALGLATYKTSLCWQYCRSVSNECVIKEELIDIAPLKDRTRGIDVKGTMMAAFVKANYSKSV